MLKINHNAGFYSCSSVRLDNIISYFNSNKVLPKIVDSTKQYLWYKKNNNEDVDIDFFENYNNIDIDISYLEKINYYHDKQFENYKNLDYKNICPFVKKYFFPSSSIKNIIIELEKKYNLNEFSYPNLCVLFYRGNDKCTETKLCSYESIIEKAKLLQQKNPYVVFIVQSDETNFIERIRQEFPTSFYFEQEIRHMRKNNNSTVDKVFKVLNHDFSKYYLAITIIMSKCNYIICNSGNCSIWIMLYRGNSNNVDQFLINKWI